MSIRSVCLKNNNIMSHYSNKNVIAFVSAKVPVASIQLYDEVVDTLCLFYITEGVLITTWRDLQNI